MGSINLAVNMWTSLGISICMFMLYNDVESQITIVNNQQNCHGNSECEQHNNFGGGVFIPGIGFVPNGSQPPQPPSGNQIGSRKGLGNFLNKLGIRKPKGCPSEIKVTGFFDIEANGIYQKQQEQISNRPLYLNRNGVVISFHELYGNWWITDKRNAGQNSGYAWFPQKEGYQCPPDTNTVNRGGSDEPLFVKVESQ